MRGPRSSGQLALELLRLGPHAYPTAPQDPRNGGHFRVREVRPPERQVVSPDEGFTLHLHPAFSTRIHDGSSRYIRLARQHRHAPALQHPVHHTNLNTKTAPRIPGESTCGAAPHTRESQLSYDFVISDRPVVNLHPSGRMNVIPSLR